ncbi:hypothetical protein [Salinicola lusitanus]|uniref:capsular polysaccharide export protein, LipB/KpsS family n=1 Tax=Salinicola lusitanus TaxID=1949085 RepID=UPI000DA1E5F8|nr:hypothetical protein [Salinicola lusitanus]
MSKVTKLIKHPIKFFEDAAKKKRELSKLSSVKNPVFAFRINDWKRPIIEAWMPDKTFIYVPFKANEVELEKKWLPLIEKTPNAEVLAWGMNLPKIISNTSKPLRYVEDGFIRSVELGSKHTPPLSLNFDSKTPYFDATKESDLESILSSYDFDSDKELMARAAENIRNICALGISKYNNGERKSPEKIYPPKTERKRILVVGQVEDDASIVYGCERKCNNNDVVRLAAFENPNAEIYYKPHPDVLHQRRKMLSDPSEVEDVCKLITENVAIADVLATVDHVYTITSQVGFEALLRGIKVTTLGCPFYSGWGLTDDRQKNERRKRHLKVEELFAASYILYPEYYDPIYQEKTTLEKTLEHIQLQLASSAHKSKNSSPQNVEHSVTVVVGFSAWKSFIRKYFSNTKVIFVPKGVTPADFKSKFEKYFLTEPQNTVVLVWGTLIPGFIKRAADKNSVKVKYVEDGFIRSVQLGATKAPPMSLVYDAKVPYFDARYPSDLENILNTYDFNSDSELMLQAKQCIELIINNKLSKYNHTKSHDMRTVYGPKSKKRILVIGQVEDDASIKLGCDRPVTNNALVRLAKKENPEAEIIYKPHPDVMNGYRAMQSDPKNVAQIATIIGSDVSIAQSFETIDHVYTITSLSGFEALLRGIKVTTIGCPFYSGWGLTDDRQPNARRNRQLKVEEIFAASYLLYSNYYDPETGQKTSLNKAIKKIIREREFVDLMDDSPHVNNIDADEVLKPVKGNELKPVADSVEINIEGSGGEYIYVHDKTPESQELYKKLLKLNPRRGIMKLITPFEIDFNESLEYLHRLSLAIIKALSSIDGDVRGVIFGNNIANIDVLIFNACRKLNLPRFFVGTSFCYFEKKNIGDLAFDVYYSASSFSTDDCFAFKGGVLKCVESLKLPLLGFDSHDHDFSYGRYLVSSDSKKILTLVVDKISDVDAVLEILTCYFSPFSFCILVYSEQISLRQKMCQLLSECGYEIFNQDSMVGILSHEESLYISDYVLASVDQDKLEVLERVRAGKVIKIDSFSDVEQGVLTTCGISQRDIAGALKKDLDFLGGELDTDVVRHHPKVGLSSLLDPQYEIRYGAHSGKGAWKQAQRYLPQMLGAYHRDITVDTETPLSELARCDYFIQWGAKVTEKKVAQQYLASSLMVPNYIAEDGFIRSMDIGLSGDPGLSIILDGKAAYYDAFNKSSLCHALESDYELSEVELKRAEDLIFSIKANRVTKYNHAPHLNIKIGDPSKPKILLIDQRYGDQSIVAGKADEKSFGRMLKHAIEDYPDHEVLIKRHPDATKGGKQSYFSPENISFANDIERVIVIDYEINPYSLFEQVEQVWVATSGMGLEALIAGKKVRCYGVPFYSGWGVTEDVAVNNFRPRVRSLPEIVFFSYIMFSKYFSPSTMQACQVEDLVEYISNNSNADSYI